MQTVVYTRIPRCSPALVDAVAAFPVADLHEAMGAISGRIGLMSPKMRPVAPGQRIAGLAVTSHNYPGDNLMIHAALNVAEKGDVLVLVNGGVPQGALWGDVASTFAMQKGVAGVVADGPVRDTHAIPRMGFKVWSTVVSPAHPEKRGPGAVNVPVVCDGVRVMPGDIIVADDDGVLVIPPRIADEVAGRARARNDVESSIRARLRAGETLFDVMGMEKVLAAAGVTTVDGEWSEPG